MKLFAATVGGSLLFAVSVGLLAIADEALDASAIAGGVGVVIAGALLGLTFLAARWRVGAVSYTTTAMGSGSVYDEIVAAFDADAERDSARLRDDVAAG